MTIKYRRNGGIRFLTIGRLTISWSIKRKLAKPDAWRYPSATRIAYFVGKANTL
jgi:hypothetical protein